MPAIDERLNVYDVAIGAHIRQRRKECGLSQHQLGEVVGVTYQQIQKYERGTNRVSASSLVEIAHALGCKPSAFLDELACDDKVPEAVDLARDMLRAHRGIEMARAFTGLSAKDATMVTSLAERLGATPAEVG